jgi:hypothetical protein
LGNLVLLLQSANAGFLFVAPDMRGYRQADYPEAVAAHDIIRLASDVVGLVHELENRQKWGKWGLDLSFGKLTTDMLHSVVTPGEKYETKNFIDTAIHRFGDIVGSFTNRFMAGLRISGVPIVMLPFAVLWAAVSIWLGRNYRRQARALKDSGVE